MSGSWFSPVAGEGSSARRAFLAHGPLSRKQGQRKLETASRSGLSSEAGPRRPVLQIPPRSADNPSGPSARSRPCYRLRASVPLRSRETTGRYQMRNSLSVHHAVEVWRAGVPIRRDAGIAACNPKTAKRTLFLKLNPPPHSTTATCNTRTVDGGIGEFNAPRRPRASCVRTNAFWSPSNPAAELIRLLE